MDDELEKLKKQKMEALKKQQSEQSGQQEELRQQVAQLEAMVKPMMTKDAIERYGNLKTAYPQKAVQLLMVLAQLQQQGKLTTINGDQLKQILSEMAPKKKDISITRK